MTDGWKDQLEETAERQCWRCCLFPVNWVVLWRLWKKHEKANHEKTWSAKPYLLSLPARSGQVQEWAFFLAHRGDHRRQGKRGLKVPVELTEQRDLFYNRDWEREKKQQ